MATKKRVWNQKTPRTRIHGRYGQTAWRNARSLSTKPVTLHTTFFSEMGGPAAGTIWLIGAGPSYLETYVVESIEIRDKPLGDKWIQPLGAFVKFVGEDYASISLD